MALRAIKWVGRAVTSSPNSLILPRLAGRKPSTALRRELLPMPFLPSRAKISPAWMLSETLPSARRVRPHGLGADPLGHRAVQHHLALMQHDDAGGDFADEVQVVLDDDRAEALALDEVDQDT